MYLLCKEWYIDKEKGKMISLILLSIIVTHISFFPCSLRLIRSTKPHVLDQQVTASLEF